MQSQNVEEKVGNKNDDLEKLSKHISELKEQNSELLVSYCYLQKLFVYLLIISG